MTRSPRESPNTLSLQTYRWLVEEAGRELLASLASETVATHELVRRLRKQLSAEQTHAILEQLELRQRAAVKFPLASSMFFTRRSLEQATDFRIAGYKAKRFAQQSLVVDACCGVGGDLLALSHRGTVLGIDRDPLLCYLADANLRIAALGNFEVRCEDLATSQLPTDATVHIDPDRRPRERRSIQLAAHEPSESQLTQIIRSQPGVAVKLSPATEAHESLLQDAELEWIGHSGQCQQLVAWFGSMGQSHGSRRATILLEGRAENWTGDHQTSLIATDQPESVLYEPHPSILAAGLAGAWAKSHGLRSLTPGGGYLTGSYESVGPWAQTLEVLDWMPFRAEKVRSWLRLRGIGTVEIKKRNVDIDPAKLQRELSAAGDARAVVVVTRIGPRVIAILCRRLSDRF